MLARFFNSHADRSIEWFSALAMLSWCITLMRPGDTFAAYPLYAEFGRYGLTESRLALAFGAVAVVRLVALFVNGRWPRSPILRMLGSGGGVLLWGQVAVLQLIGAAANGVPSTGPGIYALLALAEALCIYRAAFDARYHSR